MASPVSPGLSWSWISRDFLQSAWQESFKLFEQLQLCIESFKNIPVRGLCCILFALVTQANKSGLEQ